MRQYILSYAPVGIQNAAISAYNRWQWWRRQSGEYSSWRELCENSSSWRRERMEEQQQSLLEAFLKYTLENSPYYKDINSGSGLKDFPVLEKRTLITEVDNIQTISENRGIASFTGGTTGASLKVIYTVADLQRRAATLDWFRSVYGWKLGKRTAWFSGKSIVRQEDILHGVCYRDDWLTKTRFFSTFHITERNFDVYWNALVDFAPEFIVGFPSSLSEILAIARARGLTYPHRVKVVFPTAETVLPYHRELFQFMLGAETKDQYASSEGAPFIVECPSGSLHILPHTGVFEVVDELGTASREGEILVTSFHTHGTPLIRYKIGDRISLAPDDASCDCGWQYPLVERIEGRSSDFVWSPEHGRINLGNLSNSTKGVPGIIAFRVKQDHPDSIQVDVHGSDEFDDDSAMKFLAELRQRTGSKMTIGLKRQKQLPRKTSGKFRIVENNLLPEQMVLDEGSQ